MTLEYILNAAKRSMIVGHHQPHCYSAHVSGQGYVNDGTILATRAEYLRQLERSVTSEIENMGFAAEYAEPEYTNPRKGIVFANWNVFPRGLDSILAHYGYEMEWSDEWSTCDDCGRAIRTQPDSYSWTPEYTIEDGAIYCAEHAPKPETDDDDDDTKEVEVS